MAGRRREPPPAVATPNKEIWLAAIAELDERSYWALAATLTALAVDSLDPAELEDFLDRTAGRRGRIPGQRPRLALVDQPGTSRQP
jgi:hypothetical protein